MRLIGAAALILTALSGEAGAQTAPLAYPADAARVDLIERVSRSIVHVKGERDAPPRPDPYTRMTDKERERLLKRDPKFFERLGSMPPPREPMREQGSGFVYDSGKGYVLTAAHIVRYSDRLSIVTPAGQEFPAKLVGVDPETGIAVLRYEGATLPALPLTTRTPRAGETALIIGKMIPMNSVFASQGMVMGTAGQGEGNSEGFPNLVDFVAFDNLLPNGGMGGGPAVNMKGEAVAIVSAIFGSQGYGQTAGTMGVPLGELRPTIDALIRDGKVKRSFIGLSYDCREARCSVLAVAGGLPSAKAGILPGDILKSVDGRPVTTWVGLRRIIASKPPGSQVKFGIERGGKSIEANVALIEQPDAPPAMEDPGLFPPPVRLND
ncbi:MAG TPA: trypsin-like peptidase domain-containing protein [Chakrabartia sp.]|nr:trypsin-like peptidase domain-containing protein [Chakrabartia sp.]